MAVPYGKYLLDRKLTEGGMAEIFLARPNPALAPPDLLARPSPIVVKRLFAHHSSEGEFVRMFFNEARLAAAIKHPNIVDIFDQGESDSTYFLAMEYIHGEDLRGLVQQSDAVNKRPPLAVLCRIIMDTLSGLHYAHTLTDEQGQPMGLVHRDVSPQNVLVTYDGMVKLIDFGIAKATRALNSEQTQAGMIKGKYAYMSPEQTRGELLDARSDVFAAGTLLWELLTWRRLFKRATDLATLVAVTEEPAPSTLAVNPEIPKELDDITMRALTPNRTERWSSAKAFHDALQTFVKKAGWDGSREAVGRYMRDIFAERLAAQAKEAAPVPIEERLSSGMPMGQRIPRPPAPAPAPSAGPQSGGMPAPASGGRPRAVTMPLQVINPALAQQARKAMVVPKSQNSLPPPPPSVQSLAPSAGSQSAPSSRSGRRPITEAPSMPMRIMPDPGKPSGLAAPPSLISANDVPELDPSLVPVEGHDDIEGMPDATVRQKSLFPPGLAQGLKQDFLSRLLTPERLPIVWAVFVGILIGVVAVLALQLLGGRRH